MSSAWRTAYSDLGELWALGLTDREQVAADPALSNSFFANAMRIFLHMHSVPMSGGMVWTDRYTEFTGAELGDALKVWKKELGHLKPAIVDSVYCLSGCAMNNTLQPILAEGEVIYIVSRESPPTDDYSFRPIVELFSRWVRAIALIQKGDLRGDEEIIIIFKKLFESYRWDGGYRWQYGGQTPPPGGGPAPSGAAGAFYRETRPEQRAELIVWMAKRLMLAIAAKELVKLELKKLAANTSSAQAVRDLLAQWKTAIKELREAGSELHKTDPTLVMSFDHLDGEYDIMRMVLSVVASEALDVTIMSSAGRIFLLEKLGMLNSHREIERFKRLIELDFAQLKDDLSFLNSHKLSERLRRQLQAEGFVPIVVETWLHFLKKLADLSLCEQGKDLLDAVTRHLFTSQLEAAKTLQDIIDLLADFLKQIEENQPHADLFLPFAQCLLEFVSVLPGLGPDVDLTPLRNVLAHWSDCPENKKLHEIILKLRKALPIEDSPSG